MYDLNIDFKLLLPYIVDAYSHVFGEEYRDIINKRVNNTVIVYYTDYKQISSFVYHLKKCKKRELMIRFLDELGYDVEKYKTNNYVEALPKDLKNIIGNFIDDIFCFTKEKDVDYWCSIKAFDPNNKEKRGRIRNNQLRVINFLLSGENKKITKENYSSFKRTKKYSELMIKINYILEVYKNLEEEYNEWLIDLHEQENFVKEEENRKKNILEEKKRLLYSKIYDKLPSSAKEKLSKKPLDEQLECVLGKYDVSETAYIEMFHPDKIKILEDPNKDKFEKIGILASQRAYLKRLGIINKKINSDFDDDDEMIKHNLELLNRDDVKKYLPSKELCEECKKLRKRLYRDANNEFFRGRTDVINALKEFDKSCEKLIAKRIKEELVCILSTGGKNPLRGFISVMFFSKRDGGQLAHDLLHEFGHVISQSNEFGVGFETYEDYQYNYKNPYNKKYRLHERLNETFNDIFTIEANEYLRSKGIYLIENKEVTYLDTSDSNTRKIVKELLTPLVNKFREPVVKSIIKTNPYELTKYIGEDNYDELNDALNKIDQLLRKGVEKKIKLSPKSKMVKAYYDELERVNQIHQNIDTYYENNFGEKQKKLSKTK